MRGKLDLFRFKLHDHGARLSINAVQTIARLKLPLADKSVLNWLHLRSTDDLTSYPSQADISDGTGVALRTVDRVLKRLTDGGHILPVGFKPRGVIIWQLCHLVAEVDARSVLPKSTPVLPPESVRSAKINASSATHMADGRRSKNEGEGRQTLSPHLIITEKTDRERIMDIITGTPGTVTKLRDKSDTAALLSEWEAVTEGLTPGQVGAIMAGTKPVPKWPSDFTKAREAHANRPPEQMTPEEREAARARRHADRVAVFKVSWERESAEWIAKRGPEWFATQRASLAKGVPADVRHDVCGVA